MDENTSSGSSSNKISEKQAQELAGRFDLIYPLTTNLFGYEYGGGPNGNGGMDNDKKIQVLIYDFGDESGDAVTVGFFWSKDFYTQAELDRYGWKSKTNLAEMIYINASRLIKYPNDIYSTLIHEFQHMIRFNGKFVKYGVSSSTWYCEMLAMLAEDAIAPLIGISHTNPDHVVSENIPRFLDSY